MASKLVKMLALGLVMAPRGGMSLSATSLLPQQLERGNDVFTPAHSPAPAPHPCRRRGR
jgi:hypothetical protein